MSQWYVIRCVRGHEVEAVKALRDRDYVVMFPAYRKKASRHSKRKLQKLEALYGGYLFLDRMPWFEMERDSECFPLNRILIRPRDGREMRTDQSEITQAFEMAKRMDRSERKQQVAAKFAPGEIVAFDTGSAEMIGEVVRCDDKVVRVQCEMFGRVFFVDRDVNAVRLVSVPIKSVEAAA